MASTFTTELALEGQQFWLYVVVAGWGRRENANTGGNDERRDPYRWSTIDPGDFGYTSAEPLAFVPGLMVPDMVLSEAIDLRTSATTLGEFVFQLVDVGPRSSSDGWNTTDLVTELLAIEAQVDTNGPWVLDEDIDKTETAWTLVDATGIAVDDHLHIGSEVVRVDSIASAPTISVVRGVLGTRAQEHDKADNGGGGKLYDHPRYVLGREVSLYINLFDSVFDQTSRDLEALPESQARLIWKGAITDWEMTDENTFSFACKPTMGRLDKMIGRKQYEGVWWWTTPPQGYEGRAEEFMEQDRELPILVKVPEEIAPDDPPREPKYDFAGAGDAAKQDFYARLGNQIVEVDYYRNSADPPHGTMRLQAYGLRPGGPPHLPESNDIFREILITHPAPRRQDVNAAGYNTVFQDTGGNQIVTAAGIMLAFMTSGSGTGNHDVLPDHWGAGIDVADINIASFEARAVQQGASWLPDLIIGWDGKPIHLRSWIEENILMPLGWFLYQDENGLIALGDIVDVYDSTGLPTITESDIVSGSARMLGDLDRTTTFVQYNFDPDPVTREPRKTYRYRDPTGAERYPDDNSMQEVSFFGFGRGRSAALVSQRATKFGRLFHTPLPMITLSVGLHRLELSVTDPVLLTVTTLPDPTTRTRGITARPAVITGRTVNFAAGTLDLELMLISDPNNGRWCPAGIVSAWAAGTKQFTLEANNYTKANAGDGIAARDAAAFTVGDIVGLFDSDLQIKSVTVMTVNDVETAGGNNTIRVDVAPAVAPAAGDIVQFVHYSTSGTAPAADWTTNMKLHVAQANNADGLFPNGDAENVYGG